MVSNERWKIYEILLLGCAITFLDIAYSDQSFIPPTVSILYYKTYNDNASGVGIYATNDSNIVAGLVSQIIFIQGNNYCFYLFYSKQWISFFFSWFLTNTCTF